MAERVDEAGAAYAGSQLQTQLYVNRRTGELDDSIRAEFPELRRPGRVAEPARRRRIRGVLGRRLPRAPRSCPACRRPRGLLAKWRPALGRAGRHPRRGHRSTWRSARRGEELPGGALRVRLPGETGIAVPCAHREFPRRHSEDPQRCPSDARGLVRAPLPEREPPGPRLLASFLRHPGIPRPSTLRRRSAFPDRRWTMGGGAREGRRRTGPDGQPGGGRRTHPSPCRK